jgi:hypothetical protein
VKPCLKLNVLVAAIVAALFTLIRPSPAAADGLTVCNKSTYGTVNVAVAVDWLDNGNPNEEAEG